MSTGLPIRRSSRVAGSIGAMEAAPARAAGRAISRRRDAAGRCAAAARIALKARTRCGKLRARRSRRGHRTPRRGRRCIAFFCGRLCVGRERVPTVYVGPSPAGGSAARGRAPCAAIPRSGRSCRIDARGAADHRQRRIDTAAGDRLRGRDARNSDSGRSGRAHSTRRCCAASAGARRSMPAISGGALRNCSARKRARAALAARAAATWASRRHHGRARCTGGAAASMGRAAGRCANVPNALLLGYGLSQPSFRHRMQSLVATLEGAGWQVRCEQFPSRRYGLRTFERRALLGWADVAVLHQIKLSALEARLFAKLCRRRVFDVDDAIYVRKPRALGQEADDSIWRRRKFAATCRWVDVVAAGNEILAGVARESARRVEILPTSIDASAYRPALRLRARRRRSSGSAVRRTSSICK